MALPNSKAADSQCVHSISKDRQSVSAEKTLAMFWGHEDSSSLYEPCRTDQLTDKLVCQNNPQTGHDAPQKGLRHSAI